MRLHRLGLALLALAAALPALAQDAATDLPERIDVQQPNLFPEGIEYDPAAGQFLLGSLSEGDIYRVDDDGAATLFVRDDNLIASTGIEVDEATNRLLVANADPAAFNPFARDAQAGLGIYDLSSGKRLHYVDLAPVHEGRHFINDVAVDAAGNAYVTDSFAAVIYKVEPDGSASVFAEHRDFTGGLLSLNGIVCHPDGYLIVAQAGKGELYKVPLDEPAAAARVELPETLNGADGMALTPDGELIVVSGSLKTVFALRSADDWASAEISGRIQTEESATTAAVRDGAVYVIFSRMAAFNFGQSVETFPIVRITFAS